MQSVHHVVMATYKRSIDPGRFQDGELKGPFQIISTQSIGNKNVI